MDSDVRASNINNNDRRVKRTKKALRNALIELLEDKPLNQITVKELTERADVNRATFYFYYKDMFDMLERVKDEVYEIFRDEVMCDEEDGGFITEEEFIGYITRFLLFCRENYTVCRFVVKNEGNSSLAERIRNEIKQQVPRSDAVFPEGDPRRYLTEFAFSAIMGTILKWMDEGMVTEPRKMAEFMANTYINGAESTKKQYGRIRFD
ncbi:MAG: TetR/AcrR family transcriptional regulator [Clostridiales bacterium]|nr:TetR/AcrR family transcriptional regulator [Clostridiales bacterium]